jgi:D-proline reductase (dithiol) PrdB
MGALDEFSLPVRLFLKAYPWRRIDPVPWTPLKKPLAQCRLALVSSAGFVLPSQTPFDASVRGGDVSVREIPADADAHTLIESHRSEVFDHSGIHRDPNLAFPIDRARELAVRGRIGSVNRRHLSFMGSITAPGRLIRQTAPPAARLLAEDAVDVALVVPVCPMCNQTMCLVAAELERQGISTVVVQLLREVAEKVRPPRALFVPFNHGYPLDQPDDPSRQHAVIEAALKLLEDSRLAPPALVSLRGD